MQRQISTHEKKSSVETETKLKSVVREGYNFFVIPRNPIEELKTFNGEEYDKEVFKRIVEKDKHYEVFLMTSFDADISIKPFEGALLAYAFLGNEEKILELLRLYLKQTRAQKSKKQATCLLLTSLNDIFLCLIRDQIGRYVFSAMLLGLSWGGHKELTIKFISELEKVISSLPYSSTIADVLPKVVFDSIRGALIRQNFLIFDVTQKLVRQNPLPLEMMNRFGRMVKKQEIDDLINKRLFSVKSRPDLSRMISFCSQARIITEGEKNKLMRSGNLQEEKINEQYYYSNLVNFAYYICDIWSITSKDIQNIIWGYLDDENISFSMSVEELVKLMTDVDKDFAKSELEKTTVTLVKDVTDSKENSQKSSVASVVAAPVVAAPVVAASVVAAPVVAAPVAQIQKESMEELKEKKASKPLGKKTDLVTKINLKINNLTDRKFEAKANAMRTLLEKFKDLDLEKPADVATFKEFVNAKSANELKGFSYRGLGKIPAFFKQIFNDNDKTLTDSQSLCQEILEFLSLVDKTSTKHALFLNDDTPPITTDYSYLNRNF